jgi:hypothetical protein
MTLNPAGAALRRLGEARPVDPVLAILAAIGGRQWGIQAGVNAASGPDLAGFGAEIRVPQAYVAIANLFL